MKSPWIGALLLFILVVFLSGFHGYWFVSLLSLSIFIILCLAFLPFVRFLFPDRVESCILVFPVSIVLHALLLAVVGKVFAIHRATLIVYAGIAFLLWIVVRIRRGPKKVESSWTRADIHGLFLWLFVTLAIVAIPFVRVGEDTSSGYAYRAYFNADFFRNLAVSGALSQTVIPPDNPYLGGYTLRYYWFFHLLHAYWTKLIPAFPSDFLMVQFSLVALLAFVATLFVVLRRFVKHRKTIFLLLPVFAFGGSYEGIYILHWLKNKNLPWAEFANLNVDGILRWHWKAPQIDTLYRALLYAPQHLIALAIFLIALLIWNSERQGQEPLKECRARVLFYVLLFSTLGFSAFIGATLIFGAACILVIRSIVSPSKKWRELIFSALMGLFFLTLYFFLFEMFQAGSQQFDLGPDRTIAKHFFSFFLLNWGALLFLGLASLVMPSSLVPNRILFFFVVFCFVLIFFVRIMLAGFSDISLKVGHFSHVVLLMLGAGFIDAFLTKYPAKSKWLVGGIVILVLPASITWAMDAWNSQDINNRRFTTYLTHEDAEVCRYMKNNIPSTLVMNFTPRYEDFMQDFIPVFSERSVFLGNRIFSRIFQVPEEAVRNRENIVSSLLRNSSAEELSRIGREAGIGYLYVKGADSKKMEEFIRRFPPPYFSLVMQEGNVALFRVNSEIPVEQ